MKSWKSLIPAMRPLDAISLEMAREEGRELFVDENGEVWTADKKHFAGKIQKEELVC